MKLRRRLLLAAALTVAVGAAALFVFARPGGPHPTREAFERVREGMTRDEVAATVGVPPEVAATIKRDSGEREPWEAWNCEDTHLSVRYAPDGQVDQIVLAPLPRKSLSQRLRWRLGL